MVRKKHKFDPENYRHRIVEYFDLVPGIMEQFACGAREGYSRIVCTKFPTEEGSKKRIQEVLGGREEKNTERLVYYISKHQVGVSCSGEDSTQYLMAKVCLEVDQKPDFWLVTCMTSGKGYLLPIATFDDDGNELEAKNGGAMSVHGGEEPCLGVCPG
ncbi:MAG: hypothetical protein K9M10_03025 [Candidatus Pacebacteria bacterium]|nr:hypothetical protein [Candidatus Paceibacterota bacterium]MCF7857426.1 hypothetical protein [Candidatus Paceibacterota bacterium]